MIHKQDIMPKDNKGFRHGKWTLYWYGTNKFCYEGNYVHGKLQGHWYWYDTKGKLEVIIYYI